MSVPKGIEFGVKYEMDHTLHNEHYWDLIKEEKLNVLFTTQLFPCPYLPDRKERKIVSRLADNDNWESYSVFLDS